MNYLHFDTKDLYFLVKPLTIESTFDVVVGLLFTGGICVTERFITSRLEKTSMTLLKLQHQRPSRKESRNIPMTTSESRQGVSSTSTTTTAAYYRSNRGDQDKNNRIRNALIQKAILFGIANSLRLAYMLLAMSFHIGIIAVIIGSLTGTQLCLDIAQVHGNRLEYEPLGSSEVDDTRASEERPPWYFEDDETAQRAESDIRLQNNVALTRSLDCV